MTRLTQVEWAAQKERARVAAAENVTLACTILGPALVAYRFDWVCGLIAFVGMIWVNKLRMLAD
jgi:hypothetical protein